MSTANESKPPKRRRGFRVSLRVFMLLVLLVGAWLGWKENKARGIREAIAAITKTNGEYGFDFEVNDDVNYFPGDLPPDAKAARPEPKWVQKWLGPEYFHDIHVVFIDHEAHPKGSAQRRPPPNLAFLDPLGQLRQLRLSQCDLDEDRLAWIGSLPHLKYLVLTDEQITDKGLANMARCTSLVKLDLYSNSITDSGVAEIGKLIRLKGLHLRSKGV